MDLWVTHNSLARQLLPAAGLAAVGAFLLALSGGGWANPTQVLATALGITFVALATAALAAALRQTVTVDPAARTIVIDSRPLIGRATTVTVPFADVAAVRVAGVGRRGPLAMRHYRVVLTLKDDTRRNVFVPAFEGSNNEAAMDERKRLLEAYVASPPPRFPVAPE